MEKLLVVGVLAGVVAVAIWPPVDGSEGRMRAEFVAQDQRTACVQRGIAYFREIGAWPTLSGGADAFGAAYERCQRSAAAF